LTNVTAYFVNGEGIDISGESKVYNGLEIDGVASSSGVDISYHFCPVCGSTVFYTIKGRPIIGIAVGNFVDPDFPAPTMEFNVGLRHHWLPPVASAEQFETYREE
jgi:hypothetical protein